MKHRPKQQVILGLNECVKFKSSPCTRRAILDTWKWHFLSSCNS